MAKGATDALLKEYARMAQMKRIPLEEQAAYLKLVAPIKTAAPEPDETGRAGVLGALARPLAFQGGVRLLAYAVMGALIGVALLVAAAIAPTLFGYHTYIIYGSSMGEGLPQGSAAVSKATSAQELSVGDIIARRVSPDSPAVLHRIVDVTVVDGQRLFVTQGDANATPDPEPVILEGTGDRVVYSVPFAGYLLDYASDGQGRLLLIVAPLALLTVMYLREKWSSWRTQSGAVAGERPFSRDAGLPPMIKKEYRDAA